MSITTPPAQPCKPTSPPGEGSCAPGRQDLIDRIAELEDSVRRRDELLAVAAHELRNPMHALLLQVSAALQLAHKRDDADMVRRLERVRYVIDRYVKRATVLLDVCRVNAQAYVPQLQEIDLVSLLREVAQSYAAEAAFHQCSLHLIVPRSVVGQWDRMAIEQVVGNLLSNAIKYGPGNAIEIRLIQGDRVARLEVSDNGIGIDPADHERIFRRFEQVAMGEDRRGGVGLGLWIVRSMIEAHRGTISVASQRGAGATFTVELPLAAPGEERS